MGAQGVTPVGERGLLSLTWAPANTGSGLFFRERWWGRGSLQWRKERECKTQKHHVSVTNRREAGTWPSWASGEDAHCFHLSSEEGWLFPMGKEVRLHLCIRHLPHFLPLLLPPTDTSSLLSSSLFQSQALRSVSREVFG